MSFATIYNTLETLIEKGIIQGLGIDPDKKRFDPNPEPHHHLICLECKEIMDFSTDIPLHIQEDEKHGYEIIRLSCGFLRHLSAMQRKKELDPNTT